jgi:hypothetical protein
MNRFIEHSKVVTTTEYNTVTDFHTTKHSTLIFTVYFHKSSLSVSWQRIYNTGTIKVSLNHTLPISLYYSTHEVFKSHVNSSQVYLTLQVYCLLLCLLLLTPPAYCFSFGLLLTYVDAARTRLTENISHDGYPASPLARWLLPTENTCHVTATHCCGDVIAPARKCVYRAVA